MLIAVAATVLSACGPVVTLHANRAKFDAINADTDRSKAPYFEDAFVVHAAQRFGLMALFAEVVYRRDLGESPMDGEGCRYLEGKHKSKHELEYGMPREGKRGWKRWIPDSSDIDAAACFDAFGLYYETYIYEHEDGRVKEAVIAFRGTENRKGQILYDWSSNIVAALGFEPKQYALARERVPKIVAALRKRFEDRTPLRIYATGHSLGGGLAQQAGYLAKEIGEVFTFNTSPVTNWSHLRLRGAVKNAYPVFHRIYHGGEILEKLRFISTSFTEARYGRHDIGLQFGEREGIHGHSMTIIACNFANLLAFSDPPLAGEHHYPAEYIKKEIFRPVSPDRADKPICDKAMLLK